DRASGKTKTLTEAWDRSPGSLDWSPDGKTLLAAAGESAREKIFQIDAATGEAKAVVSDHYNTGALYVATSSSSAKPRIVYSQDSLTAPADIFIANADGSSTKQL